MKKALIIVLEIVGFLAYGEYSRVSERKACIRELDVQILALKHFQELIDGTRPGHILMLGNGIWRKERYLKPDENRR